MRRQRSTGRIWRVSIQRYGDRRRIAGGARSLILPSCTCSRQRRSIICAPRIPRDASRSGGLGQLAVHTGSFANLDEDGGMEPARFPSNFPQCLLLDDPQSTGVVGKVQPLFLGEQRGLFVRGKMELKDSKRLAKACGGRRDEAV